MGRTIDNIYSTDLAFTAELYDGDVISWGDEEFGGITPEELHGRRIDTIYSNRHAFAAKMTDGTVITCGDQEYGGTIDDNTRLLFDQAHKIIHP